jgi:hypothetical protein
MTVPVRDLAAAGPLPAPLRLALAAEILVAYVRTRWLLRQPDFRRTLERAGAGGTRASGQGRDAALAARRLARAVARTLALLPTDSRCLVRSLVLTSMLSRRRIESRLVVGVRPGTRFAAHAWVEQEGVPLFDPAGFERLLEH